MKKYRVINTIESFQSVDIEADSIDQAAIISDEIDWDEIQVKPTGQSSEIFELDEDRNPIQSEKRIPVVGVYYVIGFGSDCDGFSSFHCQAFASKEAAYECESDNAEWSDGVMYGVYTDMRIVAEYCNDWNRAIPMADPDEEATYLNRIKP